MTVTQIMQWYFSLSSEFQKFLETECNIDCLSKYEDLQNAVIDLSKFEGDVKPSWIEPLNIIKKESNINTTFSEPRMSLTDFKAYINDISTGIFYASDNEIEMAYVMCQNKKTRLELYCHEHNIQDYQDTSKFMPILIFLYKIKMDSKFKIFVHVSKESEKSYSNFVKILFLRIHLAKNNKYISDDMEMAVNINFIIITDYNHIYTNPTDVLIVGENWKDTFNVNCNSHQIVRSSSGSMLVIL